MLPLASITERGHLRTYSNYSSWHAQNAVGEFIDQLPQKKVDYYRAAEKFALTLYRSIDENATIFLDKTPRYYLIIDFLAQVFPEAKFIFLFRNPLEVLASIISTWGNNSLHVTHWAVDLFRGPSCLYTGYHKYRDRSLRITYRDLVESPEIQLENLSRFLDVEFSSEALSKWTDVDLTGAMGDSKIRTKSTIERASLGAWKNVLNTHIRRRYARWYLKSLGEETLSLFGEDLHSLQNELDRLRCTWDHTFIDAAEIITASLGRSLAVKVLREQFRQNMLKVDLIT
jgi:hypothetical protein